MLLVLCHAFYKLNSHKHKALVNFDEVDRLCESGDPYTNCLSQRQFKTLLHVHLLTFAGKVALLRILIGERNRAA